MTISQPSLSCEKCSVLQCPGVLSATVMYHPASLYIPIDRLLFFHSDEPQYPVSRPTGASEAMEEAARRKLLEKEKVAHLYSVMLLLACFVCSPFCLPSHSFHLKIRHTHSHLRTFPHSQVASNTASPKFSITATPVVCVSTAALYR